MPAAPPSTARCTARDWARVPIIRCIRACASSTSPRLRYATPRQIFDQLLDRPLSMEYCLRLGLRGYGVYYQPQSSLVLLELGSALGFGNRNGGRDKKHA